MSPCRKTVINGKEIEEYYWAGSMVVYVDGKLFKGTYDAAIDAAEKDGE